jgi:hypothetical protein
MENVISPRTHRTIRTSRCVDDAAVPATGMKSMTSPTPASERKRVIRAAVSGKYSCLVVKAAATVGRTVQWPPRCCRAAPREWSESRSAAHRTSRRNRWWPPARRGLKVTDEPVVGDEWIVTHRGGPFSTCRTLLGAELELPAWVGDRGHTSPRRAMLGSANAHD